MMDVLIQWLILLAVFIGVLCVGGWLADKLIPPGK